MVLPPHPELGVEWAGVYVAPDAVYLRRHARGLGPYDGTSIWRVPRSGDEPELVVADAWPNDVAVREGEIALAGWFGCGAETFDEDVLRWPSGERVFGRAREHLGQLDRVAFEGSRIHWVHEGRHFESGRVRPDDDASYVGVWSRGDEVLLVDERSSPEGYGLGLRVVRAGETRSEHTLAGGMTSLAFDDDAVYFTRTSDAGGFGPECASCGLYRLDRASGEVVRLLDSRSIPWLPHHVALVEGVVYFPESTGVGAFDLRTNVRIELPSFPIEALDVGVDEGCIYAVDDRGALATVAR